MDETEREELKEAYRKEKDPIVVARMLAVHMVYVRKAGIDETAVRLMRSAGWVRNWLRRYDERGLDDLRIFPKQQVHADPPLRGIIRLHTGVPLGKVAKCGSLECETMPNRNGLSMASVPIYRTIVR